MEKKESIILKEEQEIEPVHFILLVVADIILLLTGLVSFIFTNFSYNLIKKAIPETALSIINLTWLSIVWMILAYILFVAVYNIKKKLTKDWTYFVMVLGIIVLLTANVIPGILILASAVMQIVKNIKLSRYKEE